MHWHFTSWTIVDFKCAVIRYTRRNIRKLATAQRCASNVPSCVSYRVQIIDIINSLVQGNTNMRALKPLIVFTVIVVSISYCRSSRCEINVVFHVSHFHELLYIYSLHIVSYHNVILAWILISIYKKYDIYIYSAKDFVHSMICSINIYFHLIL